MIVLQAFVHMAIVTGLFPVSGQPLPFISKGGTSILVMSVALGMMLSVSKHAVRSNNTKKEINREIRELPDGINSVNPMQLKK
jgi:cell division protein FtsW